MDKADKVNDSKPARRRDSGTQDVTTSTSADHVLRAQTPKPAAPTRRRRRLSSLLGLHGTSSADNASSETPLDQPPTGRTLRRLSSLIGAQDASRSVDHAAAAGLPGRVSNVMQPHDMTTPADTSEETEPPVTTTRRRLSSLFGPINPPVDPTSSAQPLPKKPRRRLSSLLGAVDVKSADITPTDPTSSVPPVKTRQRLSSLFGPGDPFALAPRASDVPYTSSVDHTKSQSKKSSLHLIKAPSRSLLAAFQTEVDGITTMQFTNEVHRILYKYVESYALKYFCLFVIILHTMVMIFETFYVVEVRAG